jgi:hypothetical protein
VPIYRTFAQGEYAARTRRGGFRSRTTRVPVGEVHAAVVGSTTTLCGVDLATLTEFGRSRHPFERTPMQRRCAPCDEAAGRPVETRVVVRLALS